jgi:hypothetical protein
MPYAICHMPYTTHTYTLFKPTPGFNAIPLQILAIAEFYPLPLTEQPPYWAALTSSPFQPLDPLYTITFHFDSATPVIFDSAGSGLGVLAAGTTPTYTPIHLYTYTPIHLYTYTPIHLYTYTPIHLYTYKPIHLYTYTPIHLYTY